VVGFILNNLFLYNLNCMIALEKWKESNKKLFPEWIEAVGSMECLNSLAGFAFNNPDYTYPSPAAGRQLFIETTKMAHPLIPPAERVPNDFTVGRNERLILVTGSNMSGKTTFLRTAGVNLLLAQCGVPVCAASFSFTPMQILSSLRISDSLQEHTSYFMAELKKLQQIIRQLQTGQPALVLIDEILRGTNSEDKTHGSEQFIYKLLGYHCLALFATHDLSLGKLEKEKPGLVSNYCFESVIENDELHFNYRLQQGIASNRNASFLMKKMEII
jgi:DNA mismatch repair ATPase MutS